MLGLARPQFLYLLVLIPLCIVLQMLARRRLQQRAARIYREQTALLVPASLRFNILKSVLLVGGLALVIVAMAGPQWGRAAQDEQLRGAQIFFAIDLSRSMLAEDATSTGSSRLDFAKREIKDFLTLAREDRVGLIGFAGTALLQCPLTADYGAVELFLDFMSPDLMPVQGTSFTSALAVAKKAFADVKASGNDKNAGAALIIMSDGEDHDSEVEADLKKAIDEGLLVYFWGVGSAEGAPIPDQGGGYKRDSRGELVSTKLQENVLQDLAAKTGAKYVRATTDDSDWQTIYNQGIKRLLADETYMQKAKPKLIERSLWFALAGFWCLLLNFLLGGRPGLLAVLIAAAVGLGVGSRAAAQAPRAEAAMRAGDYARSEQLWGEVTKKNPDDHLAWFNQGVAAFRQQKFSEASSAFAKAASAQNPQLRGNAFYNLGNSEAYGQNLDGAIAAYEDALKLIPNHKQAQDNLEYVKKAKQEKQQQEQQSGDKKDQKQDQQDDKQNDQSKKDGTPQEQQGDKDKGDKQDSRDDKKDSDKKDGSGGDAKKTEEQQGKDHQSSEDKDGDKQDAGAKPSPTPASKDGNDKGEQLTPDQQLEKQDAERTLNLVPEQSDNYRSRERKAEGERIAPGGKDW